jgi:hypothetical protein
VARAWHYREEALRATTLSDQIGTRYHLTVEMLPHREWEWLVWRTGDSGGAIRHGVAQTADAAMAAAEGAVGDLVNGELFR